MQKAGGIIALIAGIFGFIAAIITLLAGGLVAGIESISDSGNSASTEIGTFGMLGIVFSFYSLTSGIKKLTGQKTGHPEQAQIEQVYPRLLLKYEYLAAQWLSMIRMMN